MSVRLLAWSVWGLCVALVGFGLSMIVVNGGTRHANNTGSPVLDALFEVLFLTFPTVGAAIATRAPRNPIGWLLLVAGLGAALADALLGYAAYALVTEPGSLPGGALAALIANADPTLLSATLLLCLLFPTGRPPSRRWRPFVWLFVADAALYAIGTVLKPGPLYFFPTERNPVGVDGGRVVQLAVDVAPPVLIGSLFVAVAALLWRFRHSTGVERQQLKWLVWVAGVVGACTPGLIALELNDVTLGGVVVGDVVLRALIGAVPLAVGAAILRHHLYDIDVVVNRTLVYGALTALLGAVYLGTVLLLGLALTPLTEGSGLAVAGSTLAVAALFRPARARIQALVDRRFYRRRYDAARTLESFGVRLRREVDLDSVGGELRGVVDRTVQPAHVSLWLRPPEVSR